MKAKKGVTGRAIAKEAAHRVTLRSGGGKEGGYGKRKEAPPRATPLTQCAGQRWAEIQAGNEVSENRPRFPKGENDKRK